MTWIPPWSWFSQPSGGPTPGWPQWFDRIKRIPLVAHPIGAAVVTWAFSWFWPVPAGIAAALLAESVNQFGKAIRGVYGADLWLNVLWRMALALAGALLAWAGLAWWGLV